MTSPTAWTSSSAWEETERCCTRPRSSRYEAGPGCAAASHASKCVAPPPVLVQDSVPPVMGFHLGSLGFLTPFQFDAFQSQVTQIIEGPTFPSCQAVEEEELRRLSWRAWTVHR